MPTTGDVARRLKSICSKLKSAWALRVGFETRLDGLLPEIDAIPSGEIEEHFDSIAMGDDVRRMGMMLIATEHLFEPSLHHRIPDWLTDNLLPYRDRIIRAIGRFRLRAFAEHLNPFFSREGFPESMMTWHAALAAAKQLTTNENYTALSALLGSDNTWENRLIADALRAFSEFDGEPIYRKWFRESQVVDQVAVCENYLDGAISAVEQMRRSDEARVIWDCAERYAEFARQEVFDLLVQHLDFDQTSFSSDRLSQTIVCRGRVATRIIARTNGWWVDDYEATKEAAERQSAFLDALWQALRTDPELAYRDDCPVTYDYPPKHKIHRAIRGFLASHGRVVEEDSEHGFSLRESNDDGAVLLAIQKPHWRFVRLSERDIEDLQSGAATALELFFRFSSRGALVAFTDQIVLNANDIENKRAKSMIRRVIRKKEKERQTRRG